MSTLKLNMCTPTHCMRTFTNTDVDDSLTSLHWLHNMVGPSSRPTYASPERLNQPVALPPHPPARHYWGQGGSTGSPSSPLAGDTAAVLTDVDPGSPATSRTTAGYPVVVPRPSPSCPPPVKDDGNADLYAKPPHTYGSLIYMAIQAKRSNKVTLCDVYGWIMDNFPFYTRAEKRTWQSSLRHTLTTSKCFVRERKDKDERGKGGYWLVNPDYAHMFIDGVYQGRKSTAVSYAHCTSSRKRRHLAVAATTSNGHDSCNKVARIEPQLPLLVMTEEVRNTDVIQEGVFDVASVVFDEDLGEKFSSENCSSLEELVLLYFEKEASTFTSTTEAELDEGNQPEPELQVETPVSQNQASKPDHRSYGELSGVTVAVECSSISTAHLHDVSQQQDQQASTALFPQQPQQQPEELALGGLPAVYPWGGIKEMEDEAGFFMKMLLSDDSYDDGLWDIF